jgi:hypothetical protein
LSTERSRKDEIMGPSETQALARVVDEVSDLVTARLPQCSTALPAAVEDALRLHLAMGLRAMARAQAAPEAPDLRYHLAHGAAEWRAALALLQEWMAPA